MSALNSYSDLDYEEIQATLGINYDVTRTAEAFAAVSLYDVDDGAPYIQDATGQVTLVTYGVVWSF